MAGQGEEYQTKKVNINEREKTWKENSHSAHQVTLCAPLRNSNQPKKEMMTSGCSFDLILCFTLLQTLQKVCLYHLCNSDDTVCASPIGSELGGWSWWFWWCAYEVGWKKKN